MDKKKGYVLRALTKGDLMNKVFCFILIKLKYSNMLLQALEVRNKKYNSIHKKYYKYLKKFDYKKDNNNDKNEKDIWICWLQGIDDAPIIVKKCIESVKKYNKNKNVHLITEKNLSEYISIPEYIMNKWKKGIITNTHMSDIIRITLLTDYGGLWIDATTLLTGNIPSYIFNGELFMYQFKERSDTSVLCNSWIIYASKNNRIIMTVRNLLYEYWKKENKLKEYFLLHFFITMAFEKFQEDYERMLYVTDDAAHTLAYNLKRKFNVLEWNEIINMTPIHKLSYKVDNIEDGMNTFYDYIINDGEKNE